MLQGGKVAQETGCKTNPCSRVKAMPNPPKALRFMMHMRPEVFMTLVLISSTSLVYISSTNIYVISYLLYVIV